MTTRTSAARPWVTWAAIAAIVVGAAVSLGAAVRPSATVLVVAGAAIAVVLCWDHPGRLAFLAGLFLPIEVLRGVPHPTMEALAVVLVGVVVLRIAPVLRGRAATLVLVLGGLLLATALTRLAFGLARDPVLPTVRFVSLAVLALSVATLLAFRLSAHRPLLLGYLAGATLSAAMALVQAAGWDGLRLADQGANRYPGFALQTPGLSWHLAVALVIGAALVSTTEAGTLRRITVAQVAVCVAAILVCGAQGGLAGLAFAAVMYLVATHRSTAIGVVVRRTALVLVALGAAVLLLTVTGLGAQSARGLAGDPDKGFANEVARVDSIRYGVEQLTSEPVTGIGNHAYGLRYDVRPHLLPLDVAVNTGALGFVLGVCLVGLLVRLVILGASSRTTSGLLGLGLLSSMLVQTALTPAGPFADVERLSLLMIATVMVAGGSDPFPRAAPGDSAATVAPVLDGSP